jgi:hypothetical protein
VVVDSIVWTEVIEVEFWSGHGGKAGELVEVLLNIAHRANAP